MHFRAHLKGSDLHLTQLGSSRCVSVCRTGSALGRGGCTLDSVALWLTRWSGWPAWTVCCHDRGSTAHNLNLCTVHRSLLPAAQTKQVNKQQTSVVHKQAKWWSQVHTTSLQLVALSCFKGKVHPNMKIHTSFIQPNVPNLFVFPFSAEHKIKYFEEYLKKGELDTIHRKSVNHRIDRKSDQS